METTKSYSYNNIVSYVQDTYNVSGFQIEQLVKIGEVLVFNRRASFTDWIIAVNTVL